MGRAAFDRADFLDAARGLIESAGPAAVTVGSLVQALGAPTGSFYHRFASRDRLLAELWLENILAFQQGFVTALDAGDGLAAALHVPQWARLHGDAARLLLLYHRDDFVKGDWPHDLRQGVEAQAAETERRLARFARTQFGSSSADALRRARFALVDVPGAAVRPHLRRRQKIPPVVDELVRVAYLAVMGASRR